MITMMSSITPTATSLRVPLSNGLEAGEDTNDLHKLKEISKKLHLETRRPSVVQWKQVIEYRKSNGHYATNLQLQHPGIVAQQVMKEADRLGMKKSILLRPHIDPSRGSDDAPPVNSANTSAQPCSRRHRRVAQIAIPELTTECPPEQHPCDNDVTDTTVDLSPLSQTATLHKKSSDTLPPFGSDAPCPDMTSRYQRINQAIEKMRRDLMVMRIEDNKLARVLLDVRSELTLIRAQRSCEEHADMLDDVTFEMEEEEELTRLIKACDLSDGKSSLLLSHFSPLRHIGVSKMNLNIRRFSIR